MFNFFQSITQKFRSTYHTRVAPGDYEWDDSHHTPGVMPDLIEVIKSIGGRKMNHLDDGCGNGAITIPLSQHFKDSTGADLSKKGILLAKKNGKKSNVKFICSSIESLIKKKKKYDIVSAIEVIEHQYDPFKFLDLIKKITKKNGYVLISTPYHGYFKNILISLLGLMDRHFTVLWTHGHIKFFSTKTLTMLAKYHKFKVAKIKYSGRFYPLSHSMIFLLKKI